MELVINVENKSVYQSLVEFLKSIGISIVSMHKIEATLKNKHDLFQSAGMWKNKKVTSESLREKAWRK